MKLVITGVSGSVGRQLVPMLQGQGIELLLVGRDPAALADGFPDAATCSYADLASAGRGYDGLIHMAVLNNTADAPLEEFERVNIGLTLDLFEAARATAIPHFINISSIHALEARRSHYAVTKHAAAEQLAARSDSGMLVTNVYLPAVIGPILTGKLAVLNAIPAPLRNLSLLAAASLRPTVKVETLCRSLLDVIRNREVGRMVVTEGQADNIIFRFVKRAIDLIFAVVIIVFFWWLMVVVWIAIKVQDPGPGIFAQARVGRNGKRFKCYKFRTMKLGTVEVATHEIRTSSVTSIGKFLRNSKIDELPQVVNILLNEVSLVGPRPCLPTQVELVEARRANGALALKPGITGLGQINRVDMSNPQRLAELDSRYGKLQSLILDIKLILATALGRGRGDNVG